MTEKDGAIECEAGPVECTGHRWQVCVMDKDRDDVVKYLSNIAVRCVHPTTTCVARQALTVRFDPAISALRATSPAASETGTPR